MKKLILTIVCMVLAMSVMSGCGTTITNGNDANATSADVPASGMSGTTYSEETGDDPANPFQTGTWNDDVYTNDFAELKFTNPDGWTAVLDEAIRQRLSVLPDTSESALNMKPVAYDMKTVDDANNQVIVMMENTAILNSGDVSVKEYLNSIKDSLKSLTDSGITYEVDENSEKTEICGNTYYSLTVKVSSDEKTWNQTYFIRKEGNFMIKILISTNDDIAVEDILANFGE